MSVDPFYTKYPKISPKVASHCVHSVNIIEMKLVESELAHLMGISLFSLAFLYVFTTHRKADQAEKNLEKRLEQEQKLAEEVSLNKQDMLRFTNVGSH